MSSNVDPSNAGASSTDSGGDLTFNIYGYVPSLAAAIVFIIAFSLITLIQLGLVVRSRIWWLSILVVGGVGEILGWAGRLWSNRNVYSLNAFLCQEIALILAPCFFSAGCYGLLGMLVRALGPEYSPIRPSLYLVIFVICDFVAIVVQAVGGAMAAIALQNDESSSTGSWIMVGGILIQLVGMLSFCVLGLVFARNVRKSPGWREKESVQQSRVGRMGWGLTWISVWILIRCIYRSIELAQGWTGYLIEHEPYFDVLDASAMVLCQVGFCFCWPSYCLPNARTLHKTQEVKLDASPEGSTAVEKSVRSGELVTA